MKNIEWKDLYRGKMNNKSNISWSSAYSGKGVKNVDLRKNNWVEEYSGKKLQYIKVMDWQESYAGVDKNINKSKCNKLAIELSDSKKVYLRDWKCQYTYS